MLNSILPQKTFFLASWALLNLFVLSAFADDSSGNPNGFPNPIILCDPIFLNQVQYIVTVSADVVNGEDNTAAATILTGDQTLPTRNVNVILGQVDDDVAVSFTAQGKDIFVKIVAGTAKDPVGSVLYQRKDVDGVLQTIIDAKVKCTTRQYESIGAHN